VTSLLGKPVSLLKNAYLPSTEKIIYLVKRVLISDSPIGICPTISKNQCCDNSDGDEEGRKEGVGGAHRSIIGLYRRVFVFEPD